MSIVIYLVVIISLLFSVGFVMLIRIRISFLDESEILDTLVSEIKQSVNANTFKSSIPSDSVVTERGVIVSKSMQKKIPINLLEISELTTSKMEAMMPVQISNFILSTLLIIGLGGTFLAFREIFANSNITSASIADANNAIKKISDGFEGAFWASICGLFGTVFLLFVKFIFVNPIQEKFYYRLNFITQTELIPFFSTIHKHSDDILLEIATKMDYLANGLSPTAEILEKSAEKANEAILNLSHFSNELKLATEKFSDFTQTSSPFLKAMDKLFDAVANSETRYTEYKDTFIKLTDQIQSQNDMLVGSQTKFVKLHSILENVHKQLSLDFNEINANYKDEIREMGTTFGNEIKTIMVSMTDTIEKTENLIEEVNKGQQNLTTTLNTAIKELDTTVTNMKSGTADVSVKLDKLERLDEVVSSLKLLVKSDYSKEFSNLNSSFDEILEAIKNTGDSLNKGQLSRDDIDNLQNGLNNINYTLKNKRFSVFGA
jgi:hypothetical protein